MKICPVCNRDDVVFAPRTQRGKPGFQSYCIGCTKTYKKGHYDSNKRVYFAKNKRHRARQYQKFLEYMVGKSCLDCGNGDVRVLEFDHRDGVSKHANVSKLVQQAGWQTVQEEIAKCDVVCCNCHRIRTLTRMNSKKMVPSSKG